MRKVFLESLPTKYGRGKNKNKIVMDWMNSKGMVVRFIYDEIEGEFEIIDYNVKTQYLKIKYEDVAEFKIKSHALQKCSLGNLLKKYSKDFKIEIGDVFKDNTRDLIILDRKYVLRDKNPDKIGRVYTENEKWYKYKCNTCGWEEGWIREYHLTKGIGCSCCSSRNAVLGINTIWDTDRWMCDLGVSEEDAKKYTRRSNERISVTCVNCGNKKNILINKLYEKKSISCICGDGFSYPEKFMFSILKQLNVTVETQYSPKYIKPKKSDFYLPCYNMVIETDGGLGHKGGKVYGKSKNTLEELIEIDKWKDEQHLKHGVKTIRINCFESDVEYIKTNIIYSELKNHFDLSKIDWLSCEEFAINSNLVKEVCDYWNNKEEWETTEAIGNNNVWGIKNGRTIRTYLKKGNELGWCSYDVRKELTKRNEKVGEANGKRVEILRNGESLGIFKSCNELGRQSEYLFGVNLIPSNISSVCNGRREMHKGFTFRYLGE